MFRVFWIGTTDLSKTKKVKAPLKRKVCVSLHPKTEGTVFSNYIRKVKVMTDVSNHFFFNVRGFRYRAMFEKNSNFLAPRKTGLPLKCVKLTSQLREAYHKKCVAVTAFRQWLTC